MIASSNVVACAPPLESSTPPISPMSSSSGSSPIEAPASCIGGAKRDKCDSIDLSLPEMEGWCEKEGSYLSILSAVYVRLAHGCLNVYRSDEFMAPAIQRLVLQGATITINETSGCMHIKTDQGQCNLIAPDHQQQEWHDALVASSTWKLDVFYDKHHQIATGASSSVFVAKRRRTGTLFALKSIDKSEAMPTVCEVSILKKAEHANVMKAADVLESEDEIHIVQQLMDGSLRDVMKASSGGLPEQYAKDIMRAVLRALKYLHENDIVHRDIKPDNVLLRDNNRDVRVGDFGLSAFMSRMKRDGKDKTNMCGTPHYASPELIKGELVDGKSDVWACGVMLFEMLTDKLPFQATTYERLWAKIKLAQFDVKCLQYKSASIPARTLVMQMLTPAREKRISVEAALQHEWFN